jgi:hypothetical protein
METSSLEELRSRYMVSKAEYFMAIQEGRENARLQQNWKVCKRRYKEAKRRRSAGGAAASAAEDVADPHDQDPAGQGRPPSGFGESEDRGAGAGRRLASSTVSGEGAIQTFTRRTRTSRQSLSVSSSDSESSKAESPDSTTHEGSLRTAAQRYQLSYPCRSSVQVSINTRGEGDKRNQPQVCYPLLAIVSSRHCTYAAADNDIDSDNGARSGVVHLADCISPLLPSCIVKMQQGRLHPNVLPLLDVHSIAGGGSLVLAPHAQGARDIVQWLQELNLNKSKGATCGPPRRSAVFSVLVQMLRGLIFLHNELNIGHGNLKPATVLCRMRDRKSHAPPQVMLAWWGTSDHEFAHEALGNSAYRAPELAANNVCGIDPCITWPEQCVPGTSSAFSVPGPRHEVVAADMYSVGAIMFLLCTGTEPFGLGSHNAILKKACARGKAGTTQEEEKEGKEKGPVSVWETMFASSSLVDDPESLHDLLPLCSKLLSVRAVDRPSPDETLNRVISLAETRRKEQLGVGRERADRMRMWEQKQKRRMENTLTDKKASTNKKTGRNQKNSKNVPKRPQSARRSRPAFSGQRRMRQQKQSKGKQRCRPESAGRVRSQPRSHQAGPTFFSSYFAPAVSTMSSSRRRIEGNSQRAKSPALSREAYRLRLLALLKARRLQQMEILRGVAAVAANNHNKAMRMATPRWTLYKTRKRQSRNMVVWARQRDSVRAFNTQMSGQEIAPSSMVGGDEELARHPKPTESDEILFGGSGDSRFSRDAGAKRTKPLRRMKVKTVDVAPAAWDHSPPARNKHPLRPYPSMLHPHSPSPQRQRRGKLSPKAALIAVKESPFWDGGDPSAIFRKGPRSRLTRGYRRADPGDVPDMSVRRVPGRNRRSRSPIASSTRTRHAQKNTKNQPNNSAAGGGKKRPLPRKQAKLSTVTMIRAVPPSRRKGLKPMTEEMVARSISRRDKEETPSQLDGAEISTDEEDDASAFEAEYERKLATMSEAQQDQNANELVGLFRELDLDSDGRLDRVELASALEKTNTVFARIHALEELDGNVTKGDVIATNAKYRPLLPVFANAEELLSHFDSNRDGELSLVEFVTGMTSMPERWVERIKASKEPMMLDDDREHGGKDIKGDADADSKTASVAATAAAAAAAATTVVVVGGGDHTNEPEQQVSAKPNDADSLAEESERQRKKVNERKLRLEALMARRRRRFDEKEKMEEKMEEKMIEKMEEEENPQRQGNGDDEEMNKRKLEFCAIQGDNKDVEIMGELDIIGEDSAVKLEADEKDKEDEEEELLSSSWMLEHDEDPDALLLVCATEQGMLRVNSEERKQKDGAGGVDDDSECDNITTTTTNNNNNNKNDKQEKEEKEQATMLKASVYSEVDQMGQEVVPKSNDRKANAAETESMESNDLDVEDLCNVLDKLNLDLELQSDIHNEGEGENENIGGSDERTGSDDNAGSNEHGGKDEDIDDNIDDNVDDNAAAATADDKTSLPRRLYTRFSEEQRTQNVDDLCKAFERMDENSNSYLSAKQLCAHIDLLNEIYLNVHRNDQLLQQHIDGRGGETSAFKPFPDAPGLIQHFVLDRQSWIALRNEELSEDEDDCDEELLMSGFTTKVNLLTFIQRMTKPISRKRLEKEERESVGDIAGDDVSIGDNRYGVVVRDEEDEEKSEEEAVEEDEEEAGEEAEMVEEEAEKEKELAAEAEEEVEEEEDGDDDFMERFTPRSPKHELANVKFFTDLDPKGHEDRKFMETWTAHDLSMDELQSIKNALEDAKADKLKDTERPETVAMATEDDAAMEDNNGREIGATKDDNGRELKARDQSLRRAEIVSPGSESKNMLDAGGEKDDYEDEDKDEDDGRQFRNQLDSRKQDLLEIKYFNESRMSPKSPKHELDEVKFFNVNSSQAKSTREHY